MGPIGSSQFLIIGFMSLAFWLGREPEDDDILETVRKKISTTVRKTFVIKGEIT